MWEMEAVVRDWVANVSKSTGNCEVLLQGYKEGSEKRYTVKQNGTQDLSI